MEHPIAFYTPDLSIGGIGKMRVHLMRELVKRGYKVDLIIQDLSSPLLKRLPSAVFIHRVKTTHSLWSIPGLAQYLISRRPVGVITDRLRLNAGVYRTAVLTGKRPRLILSFHNPISVKLASFNEARRRKYLEKLRAALERNYKIVAVSNGVARDLMEHAGYPSEKITVVHNPVIVPEMDTMAEEPVDHPFYKEGIPVVVTAARMTEQKDFDTLLKAFRGVRDQMECRLVILGKKGRYYSSIMDLVRKLQLETDVAMLGFQLNPYKFISKASVFVLSSRWEGFGNVLVEALSVGTPVVATDCPVGPREILEGGRLGRLVPVGDVEEMKKAIIEAISLPLKMNTLKQSVAKYKVDVSADGYLKALGIA